MWDVVAPRDDSRAACPRRTHGAQQLAGGAQQELVCPEEGPRTAVSRDAWAITAAAQVGNQRDEKTQVD